MAESTASKSAAQGRRWLRALCWSTGGLVVLLVILYFILASSAFVKGVILPRAGSAFGAKVTVEDASISPFSQIRLRNLRVETTGSEPLVTVGELRARYSLWSIMGGTIKVDEALVASPTVQIFCHADGTSNLDPILQALGKDKKEVTSPSGPSKPPRVAVKSVSLSGATIRVVTEHKDGGRDRTEVSNGTVSLTDLKNGASGQLRMAASIRQQTSRPAPGTNALMQAEAAGDLTFTLSSGLKPARVQGVARLEVKKAEGAFGEVAGLVAVLDCDVIPAEIKQVALSFRKADTELARIRVHGPFEWDALEGRLQLEVTSIDRRVLNLVGAGHDVDFGNTTINSSNQVELSKSGHAILASGTFEAASLSLTRKGRATPVLDLQFGYAVSVNLQEQTALVQSLHLQGAQNRKPLLRSELARPMRFAWGKGVAPSTDSALSLTVHELSLAEWGSWLGELAPQGQANLSATLRQSGRQLAFDLSSQLMGLSAKFGSNQLDRADFELKVAGTTTDLKQVDLSVNAALNHLGARYGDRQLKDLGMAVDLEAGLSGQFLDLRKGRLRLSPTSRAKNELELKGQVNLAESNVIRGALQLRAESLDVTPYYDIFAHSPSTPSVAPPPAGAPAPRPPVNAEPPPIHLPFRDFSFDLNIDRAYLREIDVGRWQAQLRLDQGRIELDPFQLTLNGSPASARLNLDLSVPGYQYNIGLAAKQIPVEPLANSFSPAYRGQAKGDVFADLQIKGAGTTDENLRKNLAGHVSLTFTNADIQLAGPKAKLLITPIALALRVPELTRSPLSWLDAQVAIGPGKVNVTQFKAVSEAFMADTAGEIPLASVLTNSPFNSWPVNFFLRRSLAEKANLASAGASTAGDYVKLPAFVKLSGTVGAPKTETDKLVIAGLLSKSLAGIAGAIDPKAGSILDKVGGVLSGNKGSNTTSSATNKALPFNPLDLFEKKKK